MTVEYGYTGTLDVSTADDRLPTLDGAGEPVIEKHNAAKWAQELSMNGTVWRCLTSGVASGRGAGNALDSILADNFSVLLLGRLRRKASYTAFVDKNPGGAGFTFHAQGDSAGAYGPYVRIDSPAQQSKHFNSDNAFSRRAYDCNWHWMGFSVSGADAGSGNGTIKTYWDGQALASGTITAQPGGLLNANNLNLRPANGSGAVACCLIYARVLTDAEVQDIMAGKVMPQDVPGLAAYYKLNEGAGTVCTDYSGNGHHLSYSSQVWETWCDSSNLLADPTLATPALWSLSGSGLSVGAGKITAAAASASATIRCPSTQLVPGKRYKLTYTITNLTAGNARPILYGDRGQNIAGPTRSANGTYSETLTIVTNSTGSYSNAVAFQALAAGSAWEISDVTVEALDGAEGVAPMPYVLPSVPATTSWDITNCHKRTPPPSADPARQGCVQGASVALPANPLLDVTGDLSYGGWVKPVRTRTGSQQITVFESRLVTSWGPVAITIENAGTLVSVSIGNTVTATKNSVTLPRPLAFGRWVHLFCTLQGTTLIVYVNGIAVGTFTNAQAHTLGGAVGWQMLAISVNQICAARSVRLFSRALSAAEVDDLFLTDSLADRSGLVFEHLCNTPHTATLTDTSGNGMNATMTGLRLIDSPYRPARLKRRGKQIRLWGIANQALPASVLAALSGKSQVTFSAWCRCSKNTGYPSLVRVRTAGGTAVELFATGSNGTMIFTNKSTSSDSSPGINAAGSLAYAFDEWECWSGSIDFAAKTARLYRNGVKVAEALAASYALDALDTLVAGEFLNSTPHQIDALRIYSRTLTDQEHMALFLDQAPRDGLEFEYLFDADTTQFLDSSGYGRHMAWTGGFGAGNYVQRV